MFSVEFRTTFSKSDPFRVIQIPCGRDNRWFYLYLFYPCKFSASIVFSVTY